MLEIFLLIGLIAAAKRRGGNKRRYSLRKVSLSNLLTISALASVDVEKFVLSSAVTGTVRVISVNLMYIWGALATNDGGCEFGLAHSDYTSTEIEECLEANASMDRGDKIANEQSNRLVRRVGVFPSHQSSGTTSEVGFNDGRPMKTRLNWVLSPGDTLNIWVRNGSGTIWTVNSLLSVTGDIWVKDSV